MLAAILAFYTFQRVPADTPAANPAPPSPAKVESHAAVKSAEYPAETITGTVKMPAPAKTPAKSVPPTQNVEPRVTLRQNDYASARREQSARSEAQVGENREALESSSTAQDEEAATDEKSADAGEFRFYSEMPPHFFLYKPSMKPL